MSTLTTTANIANEPNFKTDADQLVDFYGHGLYTVKFLGICPVLGSRLYDMPGFPFPDNAPDFMEAANYDCEGPDFMVSWMATNDGDTYRKAVKLAKAFWGQPEPAGSALALDVLARSQKEANSVTLPVGQLDKAVYNEVKKFLEAAGGKWSTKAQAFLFKRDPRPQLEAAIASGKPVSTKKETQAFYSPAPIVDTMISHLGLGINPDLSGKAILEPEAGEGAIADVLREHGANVVCVEYDEHSAGILAEKGHNVTHADFLQTTPCATFDYVVMNPPFTKGQDIKHVTHAFAYLKAGGTLLAIMSPAFTTNSSHAAQEFRQLVNAFGGIVEHFEAGAFKESGTNVSTVLVKLTK
jgi:predicted RNA methylase